MHDDVCTVVHRAVQVAAHGGRVVHDHGHAALVRHVAYRAQVAKQEGGVRDGLNEDGLRAVVDQSGVVGRVVVRSHEAGLYAQPLQGDGEHVATTAVQVG